ncbi:MAG: outer membrane lipoprotein-sorting protein [bacterium]|nr:outer membrane lipoprotein-sorting protein [bacterium]
MKNKINYRKKNLFISLAVILLAISYTLPVSAQGGLSAAEILDRIDENMVSQSVISVSKMIISKQGRTDIKEMKTWGIGKKKGFVEFYSPARDKGTKYLRIEDELWMYLPSVEKVIKISGHLLRQSMMGSDFSYEDMLNRLTLQDDYSAEIEGEEEFNGMECYKLVLTAKHKEVTYYKRTILVEKDRFIAVKSEMFAKTGKLLKSSYVEQIEKIGDRYYPTHVVMVDELRRNSRTEFIMSDIQFDANIPESVFTRRNLQKR